MAKILEKRVVNNISKILKEKEIFYFKNHGSILTKSGLPDLVLCVKGRFVALEVKISDAKQQSPIQKAQEMLIRFNGGDYFVINEKNYKEILKKILGAN